MRTKQCIGIFFAFLATLTSALQSSVFTKTTPINETPILEKKPSKISDAFLSKSFFIYSKILLEQNKNKNPHPEQILQESWKEEKFSTQDEQLLMETLSTLKLPDNLSFHNGFHFRKKKSDIEKVLQPYPNYTEDTLKGFCNVYNHVTNNLIFTNTISNLFRKIVALALADQLLKNNRFLEGEIQIPHLTTLLTDKRSCLIPIVHINERQEMNALKGFKSLPPVCTGGSKTTIITRTGDLALIPLNDTPNDPTIINDTIKKLPNETFVSSCAAPQYNLFAAASDGRIRLYSAKNEFRFRKGFFFLNKKIKKIAFTSDGKNIFVEHPVGFSLFAVEAKNNQFLIQKNTGSALLLRNDFILWKNNGTLSIFDAKKGTKVKGGLSYEPKNITTFAYLPNKKKLITGGPEGIAISDITPLPFSKTAPLIKEATSVIKILQTHDESSVFFIFNNGIINEIDPLTGENSATYNVRTVGQWGLVKLKRFPIKNNTVDEKVEKELDAFWNTKIEGVLDAELSTDENYLIILTNSFIFIIDRTTQKILSHSAHKLDLIKGWQFNPEKTDLILLGKQKNELQDSIIVQQLFEKTTYTNDLMHSVLAALKFKRLPLQVGVSNDLQKGTPHLKTLVDALPTSIKKYVTNKGLINFNSI